MDKPIRNAINTRYLIACLSSALASHFMIDQKTMEVKQKELDQTIPSVAENQNESVKVNAKAPTTPAPIMEIRFSVDTSSPLFTNSFLAKAVIVQKRNRIANEATVDENVFTPWA